MAKPRWRQLEKRTRRLLQRYLHADHVDGGAKCVLGGCQVDAVGAFGPTALVFECKTTFKDAINLRRAIDVFSARRSAIRSALRRKFGPQIKTIRFIILADNVTRIAGSRKKKRGTYVHLWSPKYFEAVESLARAINRRALPYILRELNVENLAEAMGAPRRVEAFPALRVRLPRKMALYSFFSPAQTLLDVGYVARLEAAEGDAYQRLLKGSRLKDIADYINKEETFKNSVVISLPKTATFVIRKRTATVEVGTLHLPIVPASVWIIDGQHRIYGYAKAKTRLLSRPLSVVAVQTSDLLEQGRIFVDINENQRPVDKNLVWDLYFKLSPHSSSGIVSRLVRDLASAKSSPFHGRIYVPGLSPGRRGNYKIYMANVCDAIINYSILQAALGLVQSADLDTLQPKRVEAGAQKAHGRLRRFYKALLLVSSSLSSSKRKRRDITGFVLSNNGVAVFLRVFRETLVFWKKPPSYALLVRSLRRPLKRYFARTDLALLGRLASSEGGRDAVATAILAEMRAEKGLADFAKERLKAAGKLVREDEFLRIIRDWEKFMRSILRRELSRNCSDWWKLKVPDDVKEAVKSRPQAAQADVNVMDLLEMKHYWRMMSHNWKQHFEWYYRKAGREKNWLSLQFQELARLRNREFHFQAPTVASEAEIWRARILTQDIREPLLRKKPLSAVASAQPAADAVSA